MKYRDVKKHLNSEELHCAYYAYGDDDFLVSAVRRLFKEKINLMPDINISILPDSCDEQALIEACELLPLMTEKRLVVAEGYNKSTARLERYFDNPNPGTILLLIRPVSKDWPQQLLSKLTPIDCNKLETGDIVRFLATKSSRKACAITDSAVRLLIDYCDGDMTGINSESDKLFDYRVNSTVTSEDVEAMVVPSLNFKIYELSEAVSVKNSDKASKILKSFYDSKEEPSAILSALSAHFRRLLFCSVNSDAPDLASLLGVKEFAVTKSKAQAAKYTPLRLKKICDDFHNADFAFKSGELPVSLALELCVARILSESREA